MGIVDLKLESSVFWAVTPAQLFFLVERRNVLEMGVDSRFGAIVATILNLFIKKGEKAISPLKAMGYDESSVYGSAEQTEDRPQSDIETGLRFRIMEAGMNRLNPKKKK